jgi:hypothetical protein
MKQVEFSTIKGYQNFILGSHMVLAHTLEDFFSADVSFEFNPIRRYDGGICSIKSNTKRNVYMVSDDHILLLCCVMLGQYSYYLGISLKAKKIGVSHNGRIFNSVASCVSESLLKASENHFKNSLDLFGERLIILVIARFASHFLYNESKIRYLVDYFNALRSTTFEGKYFSTGLILTRSLFDYKKRLEDGVVMYLNASKRLSDRIDSRYWYLVNGNSSYYLTDAKSEIHYMYVFGSLYQNTINQTLMVESLHRRDIMFRTNNGRELSVIVSKGIEFIYQENVWRYRDYQWIKNVIREEIQLSDDVYNAILFYVLYCSKNDTSSIIWIPKNEAKIGELLKTSHTVSRKPFKIFDSQYDGLIKRFLSSDGATVIFQDGTVKYYGCIIKMEVKDTNAVKGTGETAASRLASNGIAIKISQDGTIKIFLNDKSKIIKF